jgi:hypothetical protein
MNALGIFRNIVVPCYIARDAMYRFSTRLTGAGRRDHTHRVRDGFSDVTPARITAAAWSGIIGGPCRRACVRARVSFELEDKSIAYRRDAETAKATGRSTANQLAAYLNPITMTPYGLIGFGLCQTGLASDRSTCTTGRTAGRSEARRGSGPCSYSR